ncbi:MAG: DUF4124 domain-containing protein [Ideonella sp.]|jgi:hypothetical protein|nr:DUF4124 domain-containing protein [Ideonella sp.]
MTPIGRRGGKRDPALGRDGRPRLAGAGCVAAAAIAAATALAAPALAQAPAPSAGGIYTCIDSNGRRLTSDRPIPECIAREQRLLNADGSVRRTVPPALTAEERAEREAQERREAAMAAAQRDAVRRDRNLMARFPNEAAHRAAREAALDGTRKAVAASERRLEALALERKPLLDEAEFYVGREMPTSLKVKLDANEAAAKAQREVVQTQQAEIARIDAMYEAELDRLRKLWAGAPPGSIGAALPPAPGPVRPGAAPARAAAPTPPKP